jgi:hypothetical protein
VSESKPSNGKKVTLVFLVLTILTGMLLAVWMKESYQNRPPVPQMPATEETK